MANILKMKLRNASTLMRPGMEASNDWINSLMVGKALMERKGLRMRKIRRALKLSALTLGSIPTMLTQTMKKSRLFQGSLR